MTKEEDIAASLREIGRLADHALQLIGAPTDARLKRKQKSQATRTSHNTLPDHILRLKEEGFFRQPHTASEAHKKLQETYPCDLNRVEVALYRLSKKRLLRRISKGAGKNNQVAYAA